MRLMLIVMTMMLLMPVSLYGQDPVPSAEEIARMRAAMPEKARVQAEKPRKLLVFSRSWGYKHTARPYGAKAIEIMARQTGAFEAVLAEEDDSLFEPANLKQFDAIVLNNTNEEIFLPEDFAKVPQDQQAKARQRDEMLKKSFTDFVREGGGLAVIHAGVASFREWPEFGEIVGARFDNHPWGSGSTVVLRIEEPGHPLTAAFKEPFFIVTDEIYQVTVPYSRQNLRVLVTVDPERTSTTAAQKELIHREDGDFAMTWVKSYGKGRVFYCALGHEHELFWNPIVLQHYLDGIQFVLGDLKADVVPSAGK
ncbi:MAG TPA: ThuA domain-containing protein [Sedimentisphaerales bacterium]|jgi:type 1 glutamine amidotransferase|nr:ThuA domain-containing protein [Sedimentisphaerales bacterium]HNU28187.1 ThuA domain-containing protein [Sedimentisphaerales bacterium]